MPYRMAMFDFDGTLMDTEGAITATFLETMDAVGVDRPTADEVTSCIGMALPLALAKFAGPEHDVDHLCATYREIFARSAPGHTTPYEGIRELLADLAAQGVTLAVATNRGRESAVDMLEEHGMLDLFRTVVGGTCVRRPKPDPEMLHRVLADAGVAASESVMVGDTVFDIEAGRAASSSTCAVVYGMQDRARLEAAAPTYVVDHPAAIRSIWRR